MLRNVLFSLFMLLGISGIANADMVQLPVTDGSVYMDIDTIKGIINAAIIEVDASGSNVEVTCTHDEGEFYLCKIGIGHN